MKNAILNAKTELTEKIIHIMVTTLCNRNCRYCCNKQYDLNDIQQVTEEELKNAHTICITGGEPFLYIEPNQIAKYYKTHYPNIKNIYVYTNALELADYLTQHTNTLEYIDGVNVSIKNVKDKNKFDIIVQDNRIKSMKSNLVYVFNDLFPKITDNFTVFSRKWQKDFIPAPDSIFRRA